MIANSNKKISVLTIMVVLTAALLAGGASLPGKVQRIKHPQYSQH